MSKEIILASGSKSRKVLLSRLGVEFTCISSKINEQSYLGELPEALALRLAYAKAKKAQRQKPNAIIIAADQVIAADNAKIYGKPLSTKNATAQLKELSGRYIAYFTATVICAPHVHEHNLNCQRAKFNKLNYKQIANYIKHDRPFSAAGSAKIESLGIALLCNIWGGDNTAIEGLPLTYVARILRKLNGFAI